MRIPLGNCFEQNLWKAFKKSGLLKISILQDNSMHGCNGAYIFATDAENGISVDALEFERIINQLQKTYFKAFAMSRAA